MEKGSKASVLRIYLSSTDRFRHSLLSETIVYAARRYQLAGATVFRGYMGFGSSSVIHSQKFWEITEKMPVVIEITDDHTKIDLFLEIILPWFDKIPTGCLITRQELEVVMNKKGNKKKLF